MALADAHELGYLRDAARRAGLAADPTPPAERDVVLEGMRLHYLDWGTAGRPLLVFLHGGFLTARSWDVVCLALRGDYHCIALDQRGHGESEWSPTLDYGVDAHARDIEALLRELGRDRPVLAGHSMGGMNALGCAARHRVPLGGVVVIDVGLEMRLDGARRAAEFHAESADVASIDEMVARALERNPGRDPGLVRAGLRHNLRQLPNGRWTWKYDRRLLSSSFVDEVGAQVSSLRGQISAVACPTLVVRGAHSAVLSDDDAVAFAEALPHGAWTHVPQAGHNPQRDNPLALVDVIRKFVDELDCVAAA